MPQQYTYPRSGPAEVAAASADGSAALVGAGLVQGQAVTTGLLWPRTKKLDRPSPWLTRTALVVSDLLSAMVAMSLAAVIWQQLQPAADLDSYLHYWPLLLVLPTGFTFMGLYPAAGVSVVQEFRRSTLFISAMYWTVVAVLFLTGDLQNASRGFCALAWPFTIAGVPLGRALTRELFSRKPWWGLPAVILGAGQTARLVVDRVTANPALDLKVMACLDDDTEKLGTDVKGVPVVGRVSDSADLQRRVNAVYAIVAMPGVAPPQLAHILQAHASVFPHVVVVPNTFGMSSVGVGTRDLGGVVALYNKQNLLMPHNKVFKHALDVMLMIPFGLVALPVIAMCALAVYLVDRGNPFYTQKREGLGGKPVHILKLRTMRRDADAYLQRYLEENPEAKAEWEAHYKLSNDPRILPVVGHFLRRTSLDELPQLWNIVKREMSFVGPRPFPYYHLEGFRPEFRRLRSSVMPGLTGYWQVTDRSDADLHMQEQLDSYYIRNWSLWMDVYILARTPWAVMFGKGAR